MKLSLATRAALGAVLGFVAFPFMFASFVLAISPFINWMNGYGFTWIF